MTNLRQRDTTYYEQEKVGDSVTPYVLCCGGCAARSCDCKMNYSPSPPPPPLVREFNLIGYSGVPKAREEETPGFRASISPKFVIYRLATDRSFSTLCIINPVPIYVSRMYSI